MGISSCHEHGQEVSGTDLSNTLEVADPGLYEQKLERLSLFLGEVFKEREALRELFELAKADEHKEDIDYSLKRLFETNENPMTRQRSAIVNAFYRNAANHRTNGEDLDPQELNDFINTHDITMLAPYMVGYFHPDSIQELTISWWTQKMEEEGFAEDPDWEGETPGYRLKLGEDGNFIRFRTNGDTHSTSDKVMAGDGYAMDNPTVVFGSFPRTGTSIQAKIDTNTSSRISDAPVVLCDPTYKSTQNIVVRMPAFRLEKNVAPWPKGNYLYLWVGLAEGVTFGSNGLPTITPNVNLVMSGQVIKRREATIQRWKVVQSAFIVSNWNPQSDNMYLVWVMKNANQRLTFLEL